MSFRTNQLSQPFHLLANMLFAAVLLAGCGGGGSGSTSTPAQSSFTAGPITGFGSVIVNGTRFDVSSASVANDEDESKSDSDLKLGMVAEIEAGEITGDSNGSHSKAEAVHFRSAIIGPVGVVNATSLVVLGQTVDVTATTVFDDLPNGLGSIKKDDVVEVFAMLDTKTGHYTATRIEPKLKAPFFKLRGVVSSLDTIAHTFKIGGETISYATLAPDKIPAGLANDLLVYVKLEKIKDLISGAWVAVKLKDATHHMKDHDEAELKGLVSSVTSQTQFSVDGIPVDASGAKFEPAGGTIAVGVEVEVEGTANNGVIIATKVSIEDEHEDALKGFELHGAIEMLDKTSKTFVLRGVTVSYGGSTFTHGIEADLANGRRVEVKGSLSTDGTKVEAKTISFDM